MQVSPNLIAVLCLTTSLFLQMKAFTESNGKVSEHINHFKTFNFKNTLAPTSGEREMQRRPAQSISDVEFQSKGPSSPSSPALSSRGTYALHRLCPMCHQGPTVSQNHSQGSLHVYTICFLVLILLSLSP